VLLRFRGLHFCISFFFTRNPFPKILVIVRGRFALKKLYIGNLAFRATEDDIRAEFENLGIQTDSVTVVRDRSTGQSRGFGFVEISGDGDLDKAVTNLNGKDVQGRAIVVNEARPQMDNRGGGGGGRGGRGGRGGGGGGGRGGRGGGGGGRRDW
jgi:cold-inducible RNA-binding protein